MKNYTIFLAALVALFPLVFYFLADAEYKVSGVRVSIGFDIGLANLLYQKFKKTDDAWNVFATFFVTLFLQCLFLFA